MRLPTVLGMLAVSVISIGLQLNKLPAAKEEALPKKSHWIVEAFEVDSLICECEELKQLASDNQVDLIMRIPYKFNRGCPILVDDFPPIMTNFSDRLLWNIEQNGLKPVNRILLYNPVPQKQIAKSIKWQTIQGQQKSILIKDFHGTPLALMDSIGVKVDSTRKVWFQSLIDS